MRIYQLLTNLIERRLRIDAHYFVQGGFWLVSAQGVTIITSLISTVFLAHYLSENEFGIYRYIIGLAVFLATLSLTGIGQAIFQAATKHLSGFYTIATTQTFIGSIPMVLASLVGAAYYYFNDNLTLAVGCLLIGLLFPWSFLFQNIQAHIMGRPDFKRSTYMQAIRATVIATATIGTVLVTSNLLWLLVSYFASQAITAIIAHWWYRPSGEVTTDHTTTNQLLSFARHTTVRNIIVGISSRLDTIIVFQQLGAASLATFAIATLIPDQIKGSLKSLVTLLIPKFTQNESLAATRAYLPARSLQLGVLLIILTIGFILLVPVVIHIFFPKYTDAIIYAQLLALGFPASIYQIPFAMMQAHTSERALYNYHISTAVIQIILTIVGISLFGLLGAIVARIVTSYGQLLFAWAAVYWSE